MLCTLGLLLAYALCEGAYAQPFSPSLGMRTEISTLVEITEVEQATRAHLEQVQQFLGARQWSEAVQTLRRVMHSDGDRLIALPDAADQPMERFVTLRHYCHMLLCQWSETAPLALRQYRQDVDQRALQWLREAEANNDEALLHRLVDELFASSSGDQGLWLLGEFALERGDVTLARLYWEQLSPGLRTPGAAGLPPGTAAGRPLWRTWQAAGQRHEMLAESLADARPTPAWLAYPDTDIPLAEIRARLVLVSILEGRPDRAAVELEILRQLAPDAEGTIAGRSGRLVDLLQQMLDASGDWPPRSVGSDKIVTFGSTSQRQFRPVEDLDPAGPLLWEVALPAVDATRDLFGTNRLRVGEENARTLSYHPIAAGRAVFFGDVRQLRALDIVTGRPLFGEGSGLPDAGEPLVSKDLNYGTIYRRAAATGSRATDEVAHFGVPRFTSTIYGSWLFARIGSPVTRWRNTDSNLSEDRGMIVGLDLAAEGRLLPGFPLTTEGPQWSFDGTPLCDGRRLLVALRRQDDVRSEAHVGCYDVFSGRLLWRRFLGAAETPGQGRYDEITHNLLTLDGPRIYFNSNLGLVASLQIDDGRIEWIVKYPRVPYPPRELDRAAVHLFRDLTPALFHQGQLVIAPADCNRLFCLEAASGQLLWTTPAGQCADANQLLGVTQRYVLVSGEYLYWLDRSSGQLTAQFPPPRRQAAGMTAASPRGYGRGVLSDKRVYWPTRDAIYVFWQDPVPSPQGWQAALARAPIQLAHRGAEGGHLSVARGVLMIATADRLLALRAQ